MSFGFRAFLRVGAVLLPVLALIDCGKGSSGSDEGMSGASGKPGAGGSAGTSSPSGRSGSGGAGGAGGPAPAAACMTPNADGYAPVWMPPKATPGVCTTQQIADAYAL